MSQAPNQVVEIDVTGGAWNAARTWTDVSTYCRPTISPIEITRWRRDEQSAIDPSVCNLVLDNSDGRFTPGRSGSPYYPYIKRGLPVRVRVNPSGTAVTKFTGFVDTISQTVAGSWSQVTLTCNDVLARVRARRPMRTFVDEAVLYLSPAGLWPLTDGDGATTAQDITGNSRSATLVKGKNAGGAYTFAGTAGSGRLAGDPSNYLQLTAVVASSVASTGYVLDLKQHVLSTHNYVALWVNTSATSATAQDATAYLFGQWDRDENIELLINLFAIGTDYSVAVTFGGIELDCTTIISDGEWHLVHVNFDLTTGGFEVYIDVTSQGTATAGATTWSTTPTTQVGGRRTSTNPGERFFTGAIGHVSFGTSVPDPISLTAAGSSSTGQTTTVFAQSLALYLGLTESLSTNPDDHQVGTLQTAGGNGFDALAQVSTAAGRPIYANDAGTLVWAKDPYDLTVDVAVTADDLDGALEVAHDSQLQFNSVTVDHPGGAELYEDTTAVTADGIMATSLSADVNSAARAYELATWTASQHMDPQTRYTTLAVNAMHAAPVVDEFPTTFPETFGLPSFNGLLNLGLGDIIRVVGLSTLAPDTAYSGYIQGLTETISPLEWRMEFNTSPLYPQIGQVGVDNTDSTLIDDALVGY